MLNFITSNLSTIFVGGLVISAVTAAVFIMISDKKKGKNSCGCNCANCPSSGMCHKK